MRLLQKAALGVPAIRRLRDARNRLLEERDDLQARLQRSTAELAARGDAFTRIVESLGGADA